MDFSQPYGANLLPRNLDMEFKSVSGFSGTRRREHTVGGKRKTQMLSQRITKLAKQLKASNPLHMIYAQLNAVALTTTSALLDTAGGIAEGDAYNQRFGTTVHMKRLRLKIVIVPGTTAAAPCPYRICIFRASVGSTLAQTVVDCNTTSAVLANNRMTRVVYDRLYSCAAPIGTAGYPMVHDISVNLNNHLQHFTGAAAGSQTGEEYFLSLISNNAAGTTAPVISAGFVEYWFQP